MTIGGPVHQKLATDYVAYRNQVVAHERYVQALAADRASETNASIPLVEKPEEPLVSSPLMLRVITYAIIVPPLVLAGLLLNSRQPA